MRTYAVLGERLLPPRGALSPILARRLDACLARYRPGDAVIVCGGSTGSAHTEAFAMRRYLMQAGGVPRRSIILENRSTDTISNIARLRSVCATHGIDARRVVVVSSAWHLPRVRYIWDRLVAGGGEGDGGKGGDGEGGARARCVASHDAAPASRRRREARYLKMLRAATTRKRRPGRCRRRPHVLSLRRRFQRLSRSGQKKGRARRPRSPPSLNGSS